MNESVESMIEIYFLPTERTDAWILNDLSVDSTNEKNGQSKNHSQDISY